MPRRIASFLPAATEIACALGLEDQLVGVSHECDFPPSVKRLPHIVESTLPEGLAPHLIDKKVTETLAAGGTLYRVREDRMRALAPDLLLTQDLCHVCAPSGNELQRALPLLARKPEILFFTPHTIEEIFGNIAALGKAADRDTEAAALILSLRASLDKLAGLMRNLPRVTACLLEWVDPLFSGGHWTGEMMAFAGGHDPLAQPAADSVRMEWSAVVEAAPEVLLVAPCGFDAHAAQAQAELLKKLPGYPDLPAVRNNRIFAVDANSYFARPGPRVVEGAWLLAHLLHPEHIAWHGVNDAFLEVP